MSYDTNMSNTDEYFGTAVQIFDCCGVDDCGAIRVDALMDKFAPFIKTDKAEFTYLKTLLDPDQCNPEINVTKLANALHRYSEKKTKADLDESFNLRGGQMPQDSDSGISSDGLQLLEELQCEIKEKEHIANQLRKQLDFCDRQHEEAMASLIAERDNLKRHLTVIREENNSLSLLRAEHDEVCSRLLATETALRARNEFADQLARKAAAQEQRVTALEDDNITLKELLSKSKDECHRINEMYAARQSALIEQNEMLKSEHAELTSRLMDQERFKQQVNKEKLLLEMELEDLLNKSNQTQLRLERSIDISYSDDQMLTALDSLNADSKFVQEHRLLDEDSFSNVFKDDPGRVTNLSLFDEIRLSFCNRTRNSENCILDISLVTSGTQTDDTVNENKPYADENKDHFVCKDTTHAETQTAFDTDLYFEENKVEVPKAAMVNIDIQTDDIDLQIPKVTMVNIDIQTDDVDLQLKNRSYDKVDKAQNTVNKTQMKGTQTIGGLFKNRPKMNIPNPKKIINNKKEFKTECTQTDEIESCADNNNVHSATCHECEKVTKYRDGLERDVKYSELLLSEMEDKILYYEDNMTFLDNIIEEGKVENKKFECMIKELRSKIEILESACDDQKDLIKKLTSPVVECVSCQTELDQASVSTQVETPCAECELRSMSRPGRIRRFLWESVRSVFQLFAVVCFILACCALGGVSVRRAEPCSRALPWRWLNAHDVLDLLLRVEYTSDVPM